VDSVWDVDIQRISSCSKSYDTDSVAIESPLSINLEFKGEIFSVGILMRTPGNDRELVIGFLYGEGIIENYENVEDIDIDDNCCHVKITADSNFDPVEHVRKTSVSSACGICGRDSISNLLRPQGVKIPTGRTYALHNIIKSVDVLRSSQDVFSLTGGSHAASMMDPSGRMVLIAEDVGRHNAVDKLIGKCLSSGIKNPGDNFIVVSGRASFELVLKSVRFGFPMLVAVGAPSSLAVDMATEHGMTLVGFVKEEKISVYSFPGRVQTI
tara:strand:+ start:77 stop:880 length:804 start_codon:yes stop_codon:yes gene_type:complete